MGQRRSIAGARMLITGASQGIGRALAVAAARQGAKVLAAARSQALLDELLHKVRASGDILETVVADRCCRAEGLLGVTGVELVAREVDLVVERTVEGPGSTRTRARSPTACRR